VDLVFAHFNKKASHFGYFVTEKKEKRGRKDEKENGQILRIKKK